MPEILRGAHGERRHLAVGALSHASIVAREYGIPCVVSVHGACDAIPDGATVVVDGMAGTVLVEAGLSG